MHRVFEFGCGTGHLTRHLVHAYPATDLYLNDLVADCAELIAPVAPNACFLLGNIDEIALPANLDLIASSSVVQWLPDLTRTIKKLGNSLKRNGLLAFASFGTSHFHQIATLRGRNFEMNYIDAQDWHLFLPTELEIVAVCEEKFEERFESFRALLLHLRNTGVNGIRTKCLNKRELADFEARYEEQFAFDEQFPLTYHAVWMVARKR